MFSVTYMIWAIWIGYGFLQFTTWMKQAVSHPMHHLPIMINLMMTLTLLFSNYRYDDLSRDDSARKFGEILLKKMEPYSQFLGLWEDVPILEYLQTVENKRMDISIKNLVFLDQKKAQELIGQAFIQGRASYVMAASTNMLQNTKIQFQKLMK